MVAVGVHEAKTTLSKLIQKANAGEEVVITKAGTPVARLVSVAPQGPRELGRDIGRFEVPDDFNEPLPDNLLDAFEGR
ncbi:MAG: type II toxin-antitoxin system Phd/YefM family antitoxin [Acidimicrobiaceae bacterium]|nr:type II toxin-antitoxin system Phd/YefM family antitoxin [Acidimicrobiaceae bacterium]MDE0701345.1 type II toxin-antitoxin system Phd/YefM family antitoxin [Acidimicrobiaceae bacterium]MXW61272.1 type II toxin-antitoxin system Phd/YefM family antitoxin [Acidimicrobiaceae bacterium]MXW76920.1 type II toxin-antitoxin system Phd/YefM family antitoxin [Acidimicrobiaceae bacterium]MYC41607.1 type II toxin-antitoxin system Phd/YefM family antitoxin [Acidimicrobiaceae bacterium]